MTSVTRENLRVKLGDYVDIRPCSYVKCKQFKITPIYYDKAVERKEKVFDTFIMPHFPGIHRPIHIGDTIMITQEAVTVRFKIVETDPSPFCMVVGESECDSAGEPLDGNVLDRENANEIGYDSIGGCIQPLERIRALVERPSERQALYSWYGVQTKLYNGILLHGQSGTGKTLIVKAIANEVGVFFSTINGPEIVSMVMGETESKLRSIFKEAKKRAPSIIFVDKINALVPSRDKTRGDLDHRLVAQLMTLMDGLRGRSNVIVNAATDRLDNVDSSIRSPGFFDCEIKIDIPDAIGRLEILRINTKIMRLNEDVDLKKIADECHGYVGRDLAYVYLLCIIG